MDRYVTRVLPLLLLLGSCQREQVLSPHDLRESRAGLQELSYQRRADQAIAAAEAATRSRCQSNETVITLRRTPGYTTPGFAVGYNLAICGDGTVSYQGFGCGSAKGIQSARIDPAEVQ